MISFWTTWISFHSAEICTVRGSVVDAIGIPNAVPLIDSVIQLLAY